MRRDISPAGGTTVRPLPLLVQPPYKALCAVASQVVGDDERPQPRQQLHGYVSTEARDGWYRFAAAHGINVTALMEAIGADLARYSQPDQRLPTWLRHVVSEARAVASSRSSRRRQ